VHDPVFTDTAKYADLSPLAGGQTYLETSDFYRSYGSYYMQFAPAAVRTAGRGVGRTMRLAQELARRMGVQDEIFRLTPRGKIFPKFF